VCGVRECVEFVTQSDGTIRHIYMYPIYGIHICIELIRLI